MITRLKNIQAGRGQYLYKAHRIFRRTKDPKADKDTTNWGRLIVSENEGK